MTDFFCRRKSLFLLLIICMLFSGMCYEDAQADSSLMCQIMHHADSSLLGVPLTDLSGQVYAKLSEEPDSIRAYVRQARPGTDEKSVRAVSMLTFTAALSLLLLPAVAAGVFVRMRIPACGSNSIICYIHQKDGKKNC